MHWKLNIYGLKDVTPSLIQAHTAHLQQGSNEPYGRNQDCCVQNMMTQNNSKNIEYEQCFYNLIYACFEKRGFENNSLFEKTFEIIFKCCVGF